MASCASIIDFRCVIVNELIGNVPLSILFFMLIYFIAASKMKLGTDTTIAMAFPVLILTAFVTIGISVVLGFAVVIAGLLLAYGFSKFIGNR